MGIPVLVLGASGSGKSTSLRNFDVSEVGVFNVAGKPLPFKKKLHVCNNAGYDTILKNFPIKFCYGRPTPKRITYSSFVGLIIIG